MRQLSLIDLFCWTTVLAGACAISPWREVDAVIRVLPIIAPTGTVIALLARGKRAAWWYAMSVCAVLITFDSLVLSADRRASLRPAGAFLDAIWTACVAGTIVRFVVICVAKLIEGVTRRVANKPE